MARARRTKPGPGRPAVVLVAATLGIAVPNGCGIPLTNGTQDGAGSGGPSPAVEAHPLPSRGPGVPSHAVVDGFAGHLARHRDLSHQGLLDQLGIREAVDPPLSFDATKVRHYQTIDRELKLTEEERALYRANGIASVDHDRPYSMASAYYAIYARDLSVLVTSDSVLHALHRSYDEILKQLEAVVFSRVVAEVLQLAHDELGRQAGALGGKALADSAADVDLYLTVARRLLAGKGSVASKQGNEAQVSRLLALIAKLELQTPDTDATPLRGGRRYVDYSQFRPRGHYTESEELQRYFRALMWLGRADLGFVLDEPDAGSGLKVKVERERRGAALLGLLLQAGGGHKRLQAVSDIVDFMVGRADGITLAQLNAALASARTQPRMLASAATLETIQGALAATGAGPKRIRSQVLVSSDRRSEPVGAPRVFQLFGQRFVLDSFVLSKVVYDAIQFQGVRPQRMMPSGLDVMAALGNDEAVRLLVPELGRFNYAANLLAARRVVDEHTTQHWLQNIYTIWLDALRTLDDAPAAQAAFPEVMRRTPWHRKQLQTQLGSWAELRHDTILYAEQSYTAYPDCEYPEGFVEPYPELYLRLRLLATEGGRLLEGADLALADGQVAQAARSVRDAQVRFLRGFAQIMQRLEVLARKELGALPFSSEERRFLKQTIDMRGGGSGPPRYDGWYANLIYGADPADWKPTIADVHTDPGSGRALEVGVGNVNFLVVAVDNRGDRAAYVGPVYSYYEFTAPVSERMTDPDWQKMIKEGRTPKRPAWTRAFQAPAKPRDLGPPGP